jgi:hypothetical protein
VTFLGGYPVIVHNYIYFHGPFGANYNYAPTQKNQTNAPASSTMMVSVAELYMFKLAFGDFWSSTERAPPFKEGSTHVFRLSTFPKLVLGLRFGNGTFEDLI